VTDLTTPLPGVADRFPVLVALDAFDGWTRSPSPERRDRLVETLSVIVSATGARGAFLDVDAVPIPPFALGFGSLSARPGVDDAGAVQRFDLRSSADHLVLGTLWLDVPDHDAAGIVRILELALDSAWSRAEVGHISSRMAALDRATQAIAGELDLDRVLQLIVDSVRELASARYAALGILDATGRIERFITSGMPPEERARIGAPPRGHGLLGLLIREGRSMRISNIAQHPDAYGFPPEHPPMTSFLGVPVRVGGRPIGNFYLTDKAVGAEFTEHDLELVEMFALHAGIAIQNARLHARVQQLAIVDERVRIGRDLHDGIIQGIYAVALSLEDVPDLITDDRAEAVARVDRAIDRLNTTIRDIRNFIVGLASGAPEATLESALRAVIAETHLDPATRLELDIDEADGLQDRLAPEAVNEILQITREALSNVARHSDARVASLSLRAVGRQAELVVEDDGKGFDIGAPRGPGHFGLANLHDRAASIGGTLRIESEPGGGTRIIVRLPVAQESPIQ
jgi:signal transduction histidine kinase